MAPIETSIDYPNDLTIHTVKGDVSAEEVVQRIEEYHSGRVTLRVIWDFSEASIKDSSEEKLRSVLAVGGKYSEAQKGGKAALVSSKTFLFGLERMYEILTEVQSAPVEHRAFRSLKDAKEWIDKPG
jgi:hypothetical protein